MVTLEDIINDNPPKGSQQWAEEANKAEVPVTVKPVQPVAQVSRTSSETTLPVEKERGHAWLYKQLNPYKEKTAEELEKERKKERRDKIFAAIGDGISALSNLYFTTQGAPNMYSGKNTMSERTRVRYDKLKKEREQQRAAYYNGLMNARRMDEADKKEQRAWQRQLQLDTERREREKREDEWRREQAKKADEKFAYQKERDKIADDFRNKQFEEGVKRANQAYNFQVLQHNDNVKLREGANAKRLRGKEFAFSDGKGNKVAIYENVWKGSMQQVYDVMLQDLAPTDEKERRSWNRQMKLDTPQKKEDYVKQNWHKSPKAAALMLSLSKIDPATMTSEVSSSQDEDYSQYARDDEDFSQYIKK